MNSAIIVGRAGQDAEIKYYESGRSRATFSVAVNHWDGKTKSNVTDWFNIGYDVGAEWDGVTAIPATFLALCLGFNITDNFGAFLESYNYFTKYSMKKTEVECNLDFGFTYTVHPRVQLDLYGMFNCQDPKASNGIGLGVAWLIN